MAINRVSLVSRVVETLKTLISEGKWGACLPPSRQLASELSVSIPTLRAAEHILHREKVLCVQHGKAVRILSVRRNRRASKNGKTIGLISLERTEISEDTSEIQMVETLLEAQGYQILHIVENKLAHARRGQALRNHFGNRSITGWLLCSATESTQLLAQEFAENAFVVGSTYPGIHLPSIDLPFETVGTHAARQLLRRGHAHFLTISPNYRGLGDQMTIDAFQAEITCSHLREEASIASIWLKHPKDSFVPDLVRAFGRKQKPTAIFSTSRGASLTAFTWLLSTGHRVPADVSFLNRDYSLALSRCIPSLGGYFVDPLTHSRRIVRTAIQFFESGKLKTQKSRLFPKFRPGETISEAVKSKSQLGLGTDGHD